MRRFNLSKYAFLLVTIFLIVGVASAQADECAIATVNAISQLGANCTNTPLGSACYGSGPLTASTTGNAAFTAPGNTVSVNNIQSVGTSTTAGPNDFGAALFRLNTGNNQEVRLFLLGDIQINADAAGLQSFSIADVANSARCGGSLSGEAPVNSSATLTIFGAPVQLSAGTLFTTAVAGNQVALAVVAGSATIYPGTAGALVVPAGNAAVGTMTAAGAGVKAEPALFKPAGQNANSTFAQFLNVLSIPNLATTNPALFQALIEAINQLSATQNIAPGLRQRLCTIAVSLASGAGGAAPVFVGC